MFSVFFLIGPNHAPVTLADVDSQELEAYCLFQTTHDESVERKGTGECLNPMAGISQYKGKTHFFLYDHGEGKKFLRMAKKARILKKILKSWIIFKI